MSLETITSNKHNVAILRVLDKVMPEYLLGYDIIKLVELYHSHKMLVASLLESLNILENSGFVELDIMNTADRCHEYNKGIERLISRQKIRDGELTTLSDEKIRHNMEVIRKVYRLTSDGAQLTHQLEPEKEHGFDNFIPETS